MKVVIVPILKVLLMVFLILCNLFAFIITQILCLIWNFKFEPWGELFQGREYELEGNQFRTKIVKDKTPRDTLRRWWSLDFY
jgi:hypothetical protein